MVISKIHIFLKSYEQQMWIEDYSREWGLRSRGALMSSDELPLC